MEGFYGWIRNIVCYIIFITMITNLLPAGKYEKYLRLFSGCILILLVLQPLTGSLRLEEQITALFHAFSFENDAGELTAALGEMESRRMEVLIRQYEETAAEDITRMAAMEGMETEAVSVEIVGDAESPDFGKIKKVSVLLKEPREKETGESGADGNREEGGGAKDGQQPEVRAVELVDPVQIRVETGDSGSRNGGGETYKEAERGLTESGSDSVSSAQVSAAGRVWMAEAAKLRQQISGCYQVEERYVEIRLEDE